MPLTPSLALKAARNGRDAVRAGDVAAAQRWFDLAERIANLIFRFEQLAERAKRRSASKQARS